MENTERHSMLRNRFEFKASDRRVQITEPSADFPQPLELDPAQERKDRASFLAKIKHLTRLEDRARKQSEFSTPSDEIHYKRFIPNMTLNLQIRNRLLTLIKWGKIEKEFMDMRACSVLNCDNQINLNFLPKKSVTDALNARLCASQFGYFLLHLNRAQLQEQEVREHKLELAEYELARDPTADEQNNFYDGFLQLLNDAVNLKVPIELETVLKMMTNLRLNDSMITEVDFGLKSLENLQFLSLTANWLTEIPGKKLPRNLKFLELHSNLICDVASLSDCCPPWLLHLGLSRNQLADDSNLQSLTKKAVYLRSLDLEDNDICDLLATLLAVKRLQFLTAFSLQGNPCATCVCYREVVLHHIPRLQYLDNVEVWPVDREFPSLERPVSELVWEGAIAVTGHRLMGVPQPPTEKLNKKKVVKTFQLEVEFPLLDPTLRDDTLREEDAEETEEELEEKPDKGTRTGSKGGKQKDRKSDKGGGKGKESSEKGGKKENADKGTGKKESKSKGKSGSQSKGKSEKSSHSQVENSFNPLEGVPVAKPRYKSSWFISERQPWSKVIKFPPFTIPAPENDLTLLRDSLRSRVCVRVVLLKVLPPGKPKKMPKPKKGKPPPVPPPPPEEKIVGKTVLAEFFLDLQSVAWCDLSQDYNWAVDENGKRPKYAEPSVIGENLWGLIYDEPKGKKGKKGGKEKKEKGKGKKGKNKKGGGPPPPLPIPKLLTCQIGVGLQRVQLPVQEIPQTEAPPEVPPSDVPPEVAASDVPPEPQVPAEAEEPPDSAPPSAPPNPPTTPVSVE